MQYVREEVTKEPSSLLFVGHLLPPSGLHVLLKYASFLVFKCSFLVGLLILPVLLLAQVMLDGEAVAEEGAVVHKQQKGEVAAFAAVGVAVAAAAAVGDAPAAAAAAAAFVAAALLPLCLLRFLLLKSHRRRPLSPLVRPLRAGSKRKKKEKNYFAVIHKIF